MAATEDRLFAILRLPVENWKSGSTFNRPDLEVPTLPISAPRGIVGIAGPFSDEGAGAWR